VKKREVQLSPRRLHQSKTFLVALVTLLFVAEVVFIVNQQRAQVIAARAQKVGSALIDFARIRAQTQRRETNEPFAQYEQRLATENARTQTLYSRLFYPEVAGLRDGLARHGLQTRELNDFYQRPGSAIAIREIGRTLFDMGDELQSVSTSVVVRGWWRRIHHALTGRS
jgi:hypothetical protein